MRDYIRALSLALAVALTACAATSNRCAMAVGASSLLGLTPEQLAAKGVGQIEPWRVDVAVRCPAVHQLDAEYESACRASVSKMLAKLARNPGRTDPNLSVDQLRFERRAACHDTFVSGCESSDCFEWLEVQIPLSS